MVIMDVKEYFPEIKPVVRGKVENEYGILNLNLQKSENVLTGYIWRYTYFDSDVNKLRNLSSFDLIKLRHTVEDKGYPWVVTDIHKAKKSYDLNRELMEKYELLKKENSDDDPYFNRRTSRSGVQYVYLNKHGNNSYWVYRNRKLPRTYTRKFLSELHNLILELDYPWIIKDHSLYEQVLDEEKKHKH